MSDSAASCRAVLGYEWTGGGTERTVRCELPSGHEGPHERHEQPAATTCEHGYTGDERDSCACPTCSEQQLLVKVKELTALLREFEAVPVRRLTNHTAVYERSPLDTWRARCGKAVRGWL